MKKYREALETLNINNYSGIKKSESIQDSYNLLKQALDELEVYKENDIIKKPIFEMIGWIDYGN